MTKLVGEAVGFVILAAKGNIAGRSVKDYRYNGTWNGLYGRSVGVGRVGGKPFKQWLLKECHCHGVSDLGKLEVMPKPAEHLIGDPMDRYQRKQAPGCVGEALARGTRSNIPGVSPTTFRDNCCGSFQWSRSESIGPVMLIAPSPHRRKSGGFQFQDHDDKIKHMAASQKKCFILNLTLRQPFFYEPTSVLNC